MNSPFFFNIVWSWVKDSGHLDLRLFLFPQELLIAIREESEIDLSFDTDDCT